MSEITISRVNNVPLLEVGMEYHAMTGPVTFTTSDLESAVNAFESDPALRNPIIKLGHDNAWSDEIGDGAPAFGRIENMHIGNNGQTLYGDLVGLPSWMVPILPFAYPQRSIEGRFNGTTHAGNTHQFAITAVALLGIHDQAISTLADLEAVWSGEAINWDNIPHDTLLGMPAVKASVEPDQIRRAFYDGPGGTSIGWWIRSIQIEPNAIIVDCDDGTLASVPFAIGADDSISFGDATPVKVQYVPITVAAGAGDVFRTSPLQGKALAVYTSRDESKPISATSPKGDPMNLREKLGLPETATDEEVEAALDAKLVAPPDVTPTATLPPPTVPPDVTPVNKPETVLVDAAAWRQAQEHIALGVAASEKLRVKDRDEYLDGAIKAGKFPPASRESYSKLMDVDEAGTKAHIDSLAAGVIPVVAAGHAGETGGGDPSLDAIDKASAYDPSWLSDSERSTIAAAYGQGVNK